MGNRSIYNVGRYIGRNIIVAVRSTGEESTVVEEEFMTLNTAGTGVRGWVEDIHQAPPTPKTVSGSSAFIRTTVTEEGRDDQ